MLSKLTTLVLASLSLFAAAATATPIVYSFETSSPTAHLGTQFLNPVDYKITALADTDNISVTVVNPNETAYSVPASVTISLNGSLALGPFTYVSFSDVVTVTSPVEVYYSTPQSVGGNIPAVGLTTGSVPNIFDDFASVPNWDFLSPITFSGLNLLGSLNVQTDQGLLTASTNHSSPGIVFSAELVTDAPEPSTWTLAGLCLVMVFCSRARHPLT